MNTLFSNEVTLLWPRKGFLSRHTELNERLASSLLLAAVGREDAGNIPTEWFFLPHFSELGEQGGHDPSTPTILSMTITKPYLQSGLWKQNPFNYELGSCHCFCLCFSAGILHISIAFFAHCFPAAHREKGQTHMRKTSYLCVLFCNDIFYKGMYSLSFPVVGNLIQIISRPVDITQWLLSRIPN